MDMDVIMDTDIDTHTHTHADTDIDIDVDSITNGSRSRYRNRGDEKETKDKERDESLKKSRTVEDAGLRKAQKQRRLEEGFEEQVREVEDRIDERIEKYRQERMRTQDAQLTRLLELSKRKADIESQIIEHAHQLANAYVVMKAEFEVVLRGRSEDVQEAMESLNALEERASRN